MKKYPPGTLCSEPECDEPVYARHLCRRCYHRWYMRERVYGADFSRDTEPPRLMSDNRGRRCEHCSRRAVKRGLCHRHYMKVFWRSPMNDSGFWDQVYEYGRRDHEERVEEIGLTVHGRMT